MTLDKIKKLIKEMTIEEKVALCGCSLNLKTTSLTAHNIPSIKLPSSIMDERENLSALGCSFDIDLATQMGKALGAVAIKKGAALAGVLNLGVVREPMREGSQKMLGEDAFACAEMANAIVSASAVKILGSGFLGGEYPYCERYIDLRAIFELYMLPFIKVASSLGGVIIPSGSINGEMACESKWLIDVLKNYMPEGLFVNEFGSVNNSEIALKAGALFEITQNNLDLSNLCKKIKNQTVLQEALDSDVLRILTFIQQDSLSQAQICSIKLDDEFESKLAEESIVLLKNNMELPLNAKCAVGVFGDITKEESLILVSELAVNYKKYGKYPAIVFLRLKGESFSLAQLQEVENARKNCKSVIVALLTPRPAPIDFDDFADAILYVPTQSNFTMLAVAKTLVGKLNPSGKLNVTYAYSAFDYPALNYDIAKYRGMFCYESVMNGYRYFNSFSRTARYPFGAGLSYTAFEISDYKIMLENNAVELSFNVKNSGVMAGGTVIFAFGCLSTENMFGLKSRLAGFKRVYLKKGEQISERMTIPTQVFSVYDEVTSSYVLPFGKLEIFIGFSATDKRMSAFVKLPNSTKISGLTIKETPSYYGDGAFNPLGVDVEKVMKTPLLVRENPLDKFCKRTSGIKRKALEKMCQKKLIKSADLKTKQAIEVAKNMSDFALEKFIE